MSDMDNSDIEKSRFSIIEMIDSFIDKLNKTRKALLGISVSALLLAPLAIGLSAYLITHPHFFFVLEEYDEFGTFLVMSLCAIIIVSMVWLILGVRQYMMLKSWNAKYSSYIKRKEQIDNEISSQFGLNEDQEM